MPTDSNSTFRRRAASPLVVAVVIAVVAAGVGFVSAGTPSELRKQRKALREDAATLAVEIDALNAEADDLTAALDAAQANVDAQQAAVDSANRAVAEAKTIEDRARLEITQLERQQSQARADLQATVVESYVSFQPFDEIDVLGNDPWGATRASTLVDIGTGTELEKLDELRSIAAELQHQQDVAAAATAEAEASQAEVEIRLSELSDALALQETLVEEVVLRQEHRLGEAAALAELDASLTQEIRDEEQKIADAIASRVPPGGISIPAGSDIDLVSVGGITVNVLIEESLGALLDAMEERGFVMGGGGYRSIESQIRLRRANCGTSNYAVWNMPASRCRPPTARPGLSQHELGLAIDFTYNGRVLRSRRTDVFRTLAELAPKYGFYNLPSEPWHWSTTGG